MSRNKPSGGVFSPRIEGGPYEQKRREPLADLPSDVGGDDAKQGPLLVAPRKVKQRPLIGTFNARRGKRLSVLASGPSTLAPIRLAP